MCSVTRSVFGSRYISPTFLCGLSIDWRKFTVIISRDVGCVRKRQHRNLRGNDTFSLVSRFSEPFVRSIEGGAPRFIPSTGAPLPSGWIRSFRFRDISTRFFLIDQTNFIHRNDAIGAFLSTLFISSLRNAHYERNRISYDLIDCVRISWRLNCLCKKNHDDAHQHFINRII